MRSSLSWPCAALAGAELGPRTTLHVGGRAAWLLEPATPDELRAAVLAARAEGLAVRVLGGGANLIVEGGLWPGAVIATERLRRVFRPLSGAPAGERGFWGSEASGAELADPAADPRLVAWAGASMPGLVRAAAQLGLAGLEGLVGVPGNIGGGLAMNAGGRWGEVWDAVESARLLTPEGEFADVARAAHAPRYRDGALGGAIAVGAVLRLRPAPRAEVEERTRAYLLEKKRAQPLTEWSAGCIFKNPPKDASGGKGAGLLIEECGLKGRRRGGAVVSAKHGNFIVNEGTATADDVLALVEELRAAVAERTGIVLETEVKVWRAADAV
jgi:UDP-N-acetylmuramate dehydrogenase